MAKVIRRFRDKETKKIIEKGTVYEGTPERIKELQRKGFLEKPKSKGEKKAAKKSDKK